jgi:hypothetical protein
MIVIVSVQLQSPGQSILLARATTAQKKSMITDLVDTIDPDSLKAPIAEYTGFACEARKLESTETLGYSRIKYTSMIQNLPGLRVATRKSMKGSAGRKRISMMGHLKRGGSMENDGTPRIFTLFQVTLEINQSHLLRIC